MVRVYRLTDPDLPENLKPIKDIFMGDVKETPEVKDPREPGESLHDYLTRKNIKCFCNDCRKKAV